MMLIKINSKSLTLFANNLALMSTINARDERHPALGADIIQYGRKVLLLIGAKVVLTVLKSLHPQNHKTQRIVKSFN